MLEPHISGIARLQRYAAQLQYLSGKFPIDIGVEFPWYPSIGYNTSKAVLQNNIRYELANILFNLGALYSQLAFAGNRTTSDGLKQAATQARDAAGIFYFLRTDITPDMRGTPPEDMDSATLESLERLCLAQAQESFWQKAVKDGMRDGTIARLSAQVSDYYSQAGDLAIKSDAISTEWIHHFQAKHHHFAAAAQFRQSRDCLEKRQYGEEVARLRDSVACVNEALKEQRWINRTVLGDLQGLKTRVTEELKRAEKDNDVIYLLPVPPENRNEVTRACKHGPTEAASRGCRWQSPCLVPISPLATLFSKSLYHMQFTKQLPYMPIGGIDWSPNPFLADLEAMNAKIRDVLQSLESAGFSCRLSKSR